MSVSPSVAYALEIHRLDKRFSTKDRTIDVLNGIDLQIRKGEILSIVGASGCGKSTLLRIIVGLEKQSSGEIYINGKEKYTPETAIGMVFQDHRLFPWLTVAENVAFGLGSGNHPNKHELVHHFMELVGLADFAKVYPHQLSGGMQQRIAIARALVKQPEILLLDEPFGALDALTRIKMQHEILKIWGSEKTTMILVTHDIDEAVFLGDRVAVMGNSPGTLKKVLNVSLGRPRDRNHLDFIKFKKEIYSEFFSEEELPFDFSI